MATSEGAATTKTYGLILPKKQVKLAQLATDARAKVFADWDDDDVEENKKPRVHEMSDSKKRQHALMHEQAQIQDPTVFQYDEVWDKMQTDKERVNKEKVKADKDRKPKYVPELLKAAKKRDLINEARLERQQQREREKEGEEFADKEVFVTAAYRKKMEEVHQLEEELQRKDRLEGLMDVKKQNDLSGFYRHFLNDNYGGDESKTEEEDKGVTIKPEPSSPVQSTKCIDKVSWREKLKEKRAYRRRQQSESSEDEEDASVSENDEGPKSESSRKRKTIYSSDEEEEGNNQPSQSKSPPPGLRYVSGPKVPKTEVKSEPESNDEAQISHKSPTRSHSSATDASGIEPEKKENEVDLIQRLKTVFAHHNDEEAIEGFRKRYFERLSLRNAA